MQQDKNKICIVNPYKNDVLSGRGNGSNRHPGNMRFRRLVALEHDGYILSSNIAKKRIALQIIEDVRKTTPPGRFLEYDKNTGAWVCICNDRILQKVCQRLREYQSGQLKDTLTLHDHSAISTIRAVLPTSMDISQCGNKEKLVIAKKYISKSNSKIFEQTTQKRSNTFMAKSVDELDADIRSEEGKMDEIQTIKAEIINLQQKHKEMVKAVNFTDLILMKKVKEEKINNGSTLTKKFKEEKMSNGSINLDARKREEFHSMNNDDTVDSQKFDQKFDLSRNNIYLSMESILNESLKTISNFDSAFFQSTENFSDDIDQMDIDATGNGYQVLNQTKRSVPERI